MTRKDETPAETVEEMCKRLGFTIDDSGGSEVIFAGKRLAAKLQKQTGHVKEAKPNG